MIITKRLIHVGLLRFAPLLRLDFDFVEFNNLSLAEISNNNNTLIAAVYCSFINKSGKQTYGLDKFYNGNARQKTVWKYQL